MEHHKSLGGGFKYFLCSSLFGERIHVDFRIFLKWVEPINGWSCHAACFSTWFPRCRKSFGHAGVSWILGGSADLASSCLTTLENSEVGSWGPTTANTGKGGVGYHLRFCTLVNQHNWLENGPFEGYFLLKVEIFHYYVSLPEGTWKGEVEWRSWLTIARWLPGPSWRKSLFQTFFWLCKFTIPEKVHVFAGMPGVYIDVRFHSSFHDFCVGPKK